MTVTWIVQETNTNTVGANMDGMCMSLDMLGIPFVRVSMTSDKVKLPSVEGKKIYYGSTRLCDYVIEHDPEGIFFDRKNFKTSTWIKERSDMLNQEAHITTVGDAREWLRSNLGDYFCRPDDDFKSFSGMVKDSFHLIDWMTNLKVGDCTVNDQTEIILAHPKPILFEIRCFVVDHKIVDASVYKHGKYMRPENMTRTGLVLPDYKDEFLTQLNEVASGWMPSPICCMDVCSVIGSDCDELKVIEFNCFNGSGFYDHDVRKIIKAVTEWKEQN